MKTTIIIAGVGGQGVLTAANILAKAGLKEGYNVIASELHGMAQRGGNVECTVRIGDVYSPIAADNSADAIIAFEPLEALRNIKKVKKGGAALTDINTIIPPLISIGLGSYNPLDEIYEQLSKNHILIKINANELAKKAGSLLTKNVVMLGALHGLDILDIKEQSFIDTISENIKEKFREMNFTAFNLGKELVKKIQ